jgi:hypothetical protein
VTRGAINLVFHHPKILGGKKVSSFVIHKIAAPTFLIYAGIQKNFFPFFS